MVRDAGDVEPGEAEAITAAPADLVKGAFLVAILRVSGEGKAVRVNISLDRGILDAIDGAAAMRKLTRSAFIAEPLATRSSWRTDEVN